MSYQLQAARTLRKVPNFLRAATAINPAVASESDLEKLSPGDFDRIASAARHTAVLIDNGVDEATASTVATSFATDWRVPESVDELRGLFNDTKAAHEAFFNSIANNTSSTWDDTIGQFEECARFVAPRVTLFSFVQMVHVDKAMRDCAMEMEQQWGDYEVSAWTREDVFAGARHFDSNDDSLTEAQKRAAKKVFDKFRDNGFAENVSAENREKLREILQKISKLEIEFSRNLSEDETQLLCDVAELRGMPVEFLESLPDKEGKKVLKVGDYPVYFPLMRQCKNIDLRRRVEEAFQTRCKESNLPILTQVVQLRKQAADLLGYPSHSHVVLSTEMAQTPERVAEFEAEVLSKLDAPLQRDLFKLKEAKFSDQEAWVNTPRPASAEEVEVHAHDWRFYCARVEEQELNLDEEQVKQYFPLEHVIDATLSLYQSLLQLRFTCVADAPVTWLGENDAGKASVKYYAVSDARDATETPLGYFYLDLHPRQGKYGHACMMDLRSGLGVQMDSPHKRPAVIAMICNFPASTQSRPSLLSHDDVLTWFHEFGHVMHFISGSAKNDLALLADTETDFVECPSQMLENWVFEADVLRKLSSHWENQEPLPETLCQQLGRSRQVNVGITFARQMAMSGMDRALHSETPATDLELLGNEKLMQIMKIKPADGATTLSHFGHMCGGYDSRYYSYAYSEVFAFDLFEQFAQKQGGVFDSELGAKYRDVVLAPMGSRSGGDLLRGFLGRAARSDAFFRLKLGIE